MSNSTAPLARPTAPLTVLTLSPSRPHAVAPTLLALGHLLKHIPSQRARTVQPPTPTAKDGSKPFSCETFTLIFSGACLALFLGRFRMALAGVMAEWFHLTEGIDPDPERTFVFAGTSGSGVVGACLLLLFGRYQEGLRGLRVEWYKNIESTIPDLPKVLRHQPYKAENLKEMSEELCDFYQTSRHMFFKANEETMCRHVVVATAEQDSKKEKKDTKKKKKYKKGKKQESAGYNIFRTYDLPGGGEAMDGVTDPRTTEISFVLDTIAAAEPHAYFKDSHSPFPMQMSSGEKAKHGAFRTVEIALEEV
ncbi:MAG: hypothetical protein LQ350_005235 [Teloschistes chrysophthalmus]|nr:MAG: hypothetical protein LQ350_005235 [Niorma chrysophthalma]